MIIRTSAETARLNQLNVFQQPIRLPNSSYAIGTAGTNPSGTVDVDIVHQLIDDYNTLKSNLQSMGIIS